MPCSRDAATTPPDDPAGIRALAVYNPIHYQELPELFMDFIASLTGKSPSTTGAGSEGALTKGPFNALLPVHDLNAALFPSWSPSYPGFTTAAGHIGTQVPGRSRHKSVSAGSLVAHVHLTNASRSI
jgi:phosphoenolpyruvate carboxykinase (diphosphate)